VDFDVDVRESAPYQVVRLVIHDECALTRSDLRHVVMLAQAREVLVELLNALFVRLDAFLFQALIQL